MQRKTVLEVMTASPAWCTPHDSIEHVARLMTERDCGAIPVVDDELDRRPIGMITDRDIVNRVVVRGLTGHDCQAGEVMTQPILVLHPGATLDACFELMEAHQIRRVPIVDDRGKLIGIVSQADLARTAEEQPELEHELTTMLSEVSRPHLRAA